MLPAEIEQKLRARLDFNQHRRDKWIQDRAAEIPSGAMVLDVGAGSCPYRHEFAHCVYISQDARGLEDHQLRDKGYGAIDITSDIANIPVEDHSFDVVLCTEVLEHVPEPISALKEFARVLRPGGRLIVTAPLGSGLHQQPFHFYGGYTPFWYLKFLPAVGFSSISIEPNGGFFEHFGQESRRLAAIVSDYHRGSLWAAPLKVIFGVFFGYALPMFCHSLSSWDLTKDFTVGYFVTAQKS